MKSHFIILILSFVFLVTFVNAGTPVSEIIHGMTGDMNGTGPFMVYISTAKSKLNADGSVPERSGCSGILIKKNIVLTAAHCFLISGFDEVDVHFTLKYDPLGKYPVRHGTRIVTHPEYNKSKDIYKNDGYYENDIAIIEFAGGLPNGYRPINYKVNDDAAYLGSSVLVAGYGLIYDTSDPRVSVDYLNNLGRLYSTRLIFDSVFPQLNVFYTHISADQSANTGMCRGDSGGAAVVRDANKNFLLVGVNSATGNDKTCFGTAYFTRVALFQNWIEENIK